MWNFHSSIALPLESIARTHFHSESERPRTKIYDADFIECGHFVEVMSIILREKTSFENSRTDVDEFIEQSAQYYAKNASQIPQDDANRLFEEFKTLFEQ
ncbi:MAG: hypothetical protein IKH57_05625 [Clostridia bacterium]|nr:hypothetical protein [Clostridia bacterium]